MFNIRKLLFGLIALCSISYVSATPTLLKDVNGVLIGASDVKVGDSYYDVAFPRSGSCNSLFNNCSTFQFHTGADALAASQALLDSVFVESRYNTAESFISSGIGFVQLRTPFESEYVPISGMPALHFSEVFIYAFYDDGDLYFARTAQCCSWNHADFGFDISQVNHTYAVWTPSVSSVPEPTSLALFSAGILGLAASIRKRKP